MNKLLPTFAFTAACFSVLFYFAGIPGLVVIALAITALIALVGQVFSDPDRPVAGRVNCILAVVLAATPLMIPVVQAFRLGIQERARDRQTKPVFANMEASFEATKKPIEEYYKQNHLMPEVSGNEILPYVDETGAKVTPPVDPAIIAPADPFSKTQTSMRWVNVRDEGVLLVSCGQDGVPEMPLPGVAMDGPPSDPMAKFALLGQDPRWLTYDPTNGALSLGDQIYYHGKQPYEQTFAPLFAAWDKAESASPYSPTKRHRASDHDDNPQSVRDAIAARSLLGRGDYLAALALASRSVGESHPMEAQWKPADIEAQKIRGIALYNLAAYRESADALIEYTKDAPNDAEAQYYLAAALYHGGDPDDALRHVAAAAQISPNDPITAEAEARFVEMQSRNRPNFKTPALIESQRAAAAAAAAEAAKTPLGLPPK